MRILLFQIRDPDDKMLKHEYECFVDKLRPLEGSIDLELSSYNVIAEPNGYDKIWKDYDLVLIGGSGDYGCVGNSDAWFLRFCGVLQEIVDNERPLFASCFGHQALAVALGGEVITDKARAELGTLEVTLSEAGQMDPLLSTLGDTFLAQFGHNDQVSRLPEGAVNLAFTERCNVQAYTLKDKMVYACQFHPELSYLENRQRAERYFRVYDPELANPETLATLFRPSERSSDLLPRFVKMVSQAG